ncbi:MAG: ABC transporter ATP-binding protein [Bacteroidales bacterium]|nr:ABC transporter ATP-binding protein [Bacteroidales bacterium]
MLKAENIHKSFGNLHVLSGIDLHVAGGEIVSVVGKSGAGKSTLLQILGTIEMADKGKVLIQDVDVLALNSKALAAFRNKHIGFVFQFHHLLPEFTALENVSIPALIAGDSRKTAEKKAMELLGFLNLIDRKDHKPSAMSGGEQQRVAIARALINKPSVVLADEPSGNLDSQASVELHQLILRLRESFNQTFIIVTHNRELADMADRKLIINDGVMLPQNNILEKSL